MNLYKNILDAREALDKYDNENLPYRATRAQIEAWNTGRKPLEALYAKAIKAWGATRPQRDDGLHDFLQDENL